MAHRSRRNEGQACRGPEHRLHGRRAHRARFAKACPVHVSSRVPGRDGAPGSVGNPWRHGRERPCRLGTGRIRATADPRGHRGVLSPARTRSSTPLVEPQRKLLEDAGGGVIEIADSVQRGYRPEGEREPFGFHDGIAQPTIARIGGDGVPTGEFILGYRNHYQIIPPTPVVPAELDAAAVLPSLANPYHPSQLRDLGINGSWRVVYRKLRQDVAGFWQFMKREAVRASGKEDPGHMVWLASRLVGRWPGGAPLALAPDADTPGAADQNDFMYRNDVDGLACPIGAHIRRANPRDVIKPYPAVQSLSMSEAHRLLRRARAFGPRLFDPRVLREPASLGKALLSSLLTDDGRTPGARHPFLLRQREHQEPVSSSCSRNWCNNPRFGGLKSITRIRSLATTAERTSRRAT